MTDTTDSNETNKIFSPCEFFTAIANDDINKVRQLLATCPSVNIKDRDGNTPLHLAVHHDSLQVLEYLLNIDTIDIDATNMKHDTPLNVSVYPRNGVQRDINFLHYLELIPAFVVCRPELINMLIKAGADINTKDYLGNTLLHKSVYYQRLDVMYMLLYYNADTNILNNLNQTPFTLALISNYKEMEEVLLKYVDIDMNKCLIHNYFNKSRKITSYHPYVENFRALWSTCGNKRLCYVLYKLRKLVVKFQQWTEVVMEYIKIIFETDHFKSVVHNNKCMCIRFLLDLFVHDIMNREMVQKCIYVLLMHNFSLSNPDINYVFEQFGYCELIKIMLHMDVSLVDIDRYSGTLVFPVILFYVWKTIDDLLLHFVTYFPHYSVQSLIHFLNYFSYLPLNRIAFIQCTVTWDVEDEERLKKIHSLPFVPKLLELSRNKARDFIVSEYNITKTSQYYTIVNNLDIANTYKRILTFETPLYL